MFSFATFADHGSSPSTASSKSIVIIHTNDIHSRVGEDSGMGYAKLAAYASKIALESGTEPILVDAGDAFHGQTIATLRLYGGGGVTDIPLQISLWSMNSRVLMKP